MSRPRFNPTSVGLPEGWRLTKFTELKGCGCKVPQNELLSFLDMFSGVNTTTASSSTTTSTATTTTPSSSSPFHLLKPAITDSDEIGIGLDSCVVQTRFPGIYLVQTTDFFYPLIEDPYLMGKVTCANVLSDLYAMGVTECDNMLMLLGVSREMSIEERNIAVPLVMKGFSDLAAEAGCKIRGGQTVLNPWFLIGGVATGVVKREEMIIPDAAKPGDVLVLTKPLGNQLAVNAHQWLISNPTKWETIKDAITEQEVIDAYEYAITSMIRLNRTAARLMKEYGAHAATDVTGFGILGHASNLAKNQKEKVRFVIDTLPVIQHMIKFEKARPVFKLLEGRSSESSGGLLIAFPSSPGSNPLELAQRFCKDLEQQDGGHPCFIIGRVIEGEDKDAIIVPNPQIIEVTHPN